MSSESVINLERRDDGVAIITLTNGKVNALSTAVLDGLHSAANDLAADLPGAIIVTGGERIFAAGADISEFGGPEEGAAITRKFHDALGALCYIMTCRTHWLRDLGGVLSPMNAFLFLQGLETLHLRMPRHVQTTAALVGFPLGVLLQLVVEYNSQQFRA